jgi:hypothetical protein
MHWNGASAGGGHASSNPMASTDPGSVLEHNSNLATKLESHSFRKLTPPKEWDFLSHSFSFRAEWFRTTCPKPGYKFLGKQGQDFSP